MSSYSLYCFDCAHYYGNNKDLYKDGYRGEDTGCRAFPMGANVDGLKGHKEIIAGQVGSFTYEEVSEELHRILDRDDELLNSRWEELMAGLYDKATAEADRLIAEFKKVNHLRRNKWKELLSQVGVNLTLDEAYEKLFEFTKEVTPPAFDNNIYLSL
jgi:hypothetical protein